MNVLWVGAQTSLHFGTHAHTTLLTRRMLTDCARFQRMRARYPAHTTPSRVERAPAELDDAIRPSHSSYCSSEGALEGAPFSGGGATTTTP